MLRKVKNMVPEIYPFVYQSYATSSSLFYCEKYKILSQEGVQQGDPLGPFLFSLPTMDLIHSCRSERKVFYLDDGTLGGDIETVLKDYTTIQAAAGTLGLEVNPTKCELYLIRPDTKGSNNTFEKFCNASPGQCNVKLLHSRDLTLLGAPILPEAIQGVLLAKIESLKLMTERLTEIGAHEALFLLRNCFSIPKLTYFLRTAPCFTKSDILKNYDNFIKVSLQTILNIQLDEPAWCQSTLPINLGGLGLKLATEVALSAYLSSACSSKSTVKFIVPVNYQEYHDHYYTIGCAKWMKKLGRNSIPDNPLFQAEWDKPLYVQRQKELLNGAKSEIKKARLQSICLDHASDWLYSIPISSLGLKLSDSHLRAICALQNGSMLCQQHICSCGKTADPFGRHGLSCKKQVGRHPRHSQVNDLIKRALSSADFPSRLEPQGLERNDGKRPDGLTLFPYKEGKCLVWDFTCTDSLANSHIKETLNQPGAAAIKAEKLKITKYKQHQKDYFFVPIAVEAFGGWGPDGAALIKSLGKKIQDKSGKKRSTFFLFQSISLAMQRGNAASVLGTARPGQNLEEIYYL